MGLASLSGCHAGVGPVVGYATNRGPTFGWELSGGWAVARGAIGGSYRILSDYDPVADEPERDSDEQTPGEEPEGAAPTEPIRGPLTDRTVQIAHYAAFEPGALLGATLGAGVAGESTRFVYGAWAGAPVLVLPNQGDLRSWGDPMISIAIGWRFLVDAHEFYVTPKLNLVEQVSLFAH